MEQDQHQPEKKIWIDPELTFMPMEEIKSIRFNAQHEFIPPPNNSGYSNDDAVNYGS